jgi:hypothetical protein
MKSASDYDLAAACYDLGGTNWSEISRMAEEERSIAKKAKFADSGICVEIRSGATETDVHYRFPPVAGCCGQR